MTDLLICRQNLESHVFTFLQNSCLNNKYITDMFEKLFANSKVIGVGAFANDELVGYIIGEIKIDTSCLRGRHIWVPYEGIAIKIDQSSELIRNLYAKVSVLRLEQGCFSHYTLIPLGNQLYYESFLQLSFFLEQVYDTITPELMAPDDGIELTIAGTYHSHMGGGVGKKLMNEGYRIMKEKGYIT